MVDCPAAADAATSLSVPGNQPHASTSLTPRWTKDTTDVDIVLYVALREEFDLVLKALGSGFVSLELPEVALTCYRGRLRTVSGGELETVVVPAGKMGNVRAGTISSTVLTTFRPANIVVLGIAGSLDRDLQPGDVLVPDSVHEYLANSAAVGTPRSKRWEFQTSGNHFNTDLRLLNRLQNLPTAQRDVYRRWRRAAQTRFNRVATPDLRARLDEEHDLRLRPRVGAFAGDDRVLASGPAVGKSKAFATWMRTQVDRKAAAIEMESAGVYDAAEVRTPAPRALAIRGISDFADERKDALEQVSAGSFRAVAVQNAVSLFMAAVDADVFAGDTIHASGASASGQAALADERRGGALDVHEVWGTALPPNNLPASGQMIVGRRATVHECRDRLLAPAGRLVTLYGPPGVGKTRLALEVARSVVDDFDDHVYLVDLTTVTDPTLVITTISRALRIAAGEPLLDSLREVFRDQRVLLVLDNFEHVQRAARAVDELLRRTDGLCMLVTSLDPLELEFEQPMVVEPLETTDAKQLFRQRMTPGAARRFDDAALTEICELLDGVPLVVELVAALARNNSPRELLAMLEAPGAFIDLKSKRQDIPERHRSVRAAIAWSYGLLETREQELFRRLSVFSGGWTLETAASVIDRRAGSSVELFEAMDALADRWLVRTVAGDDSGRKQMLPAIREFARAELDEVEPQKAEELKGRHARCFLELAERAYQERSGRLLGYLTAIEREQENINTAMERFVQTTDAESALRLAVDAGQFWWSRDYRGGEARLRSALDLPYPDELREQRVRALLVGGRLSIRLHRLEDASARFSEATALAVELPDRSLEAEALSDSALVPMESTRFDEALALLARALEINASSGDAYALAEVYDNLGVTATGTGDYEAAVTHLNRSRELYARARDERGRAWVENDLACVGIAQGEWERASVHAAEARYIGVQINDPGLIAWSRNYLGLIASNRGDFQEAREHHDDSLTTATVLGDLRPQLLALEGFAVLAAAQRDWSRFRKLEGATLARRQSADLGRTAAETAILQGWADREPPELREGLAEARAAGLAMTLEDAVALARTG